MKHGEIGLFLRTRPLRFLLVVGDRAAELPVDLENAVMLAGTLIREATQENNIATDCLPQGEGHALPRLPISVN